MPAAAILIRPDRDDSEYLELASRYSSSVPLSAPAGEGALIAPRWVLTAASAAGGLRDAARPLRIGDRPYEVAQVIPHPEADLALVLLKAPVEGLEPTPPYRRPDEAGKGVVVAAHGPHGVLGRAAAAASDGRKRAFINTVDRVDARTLGLRIKPGDEASDLQGAVLPSEAGAPAYVEIEGALFVAGIASSSTGDRPLVPPGGTSGLSPEWNVFTRVSAFVEWIDQAMFRAASDEARATVTGKPRAGTAPTAR